MSRTLLFAAIFTFAVPVAVTAEAVSEPVGSTASSHSVTMTVLMPGGVLLIGTALAGMGVAYRRRNRSAA